MNEVPKGIVPVVSHNAKNDKTNPPVSSLVPSVDETTAMLEKEEAEQDARMQ
jgi:hypothetical protein